MLRPKKSSRIPSKSHFPIRANKFELIFQSFILVLWPSQNLSTLMVSQLIPHIAEERTMFVCNLFIKVSNLAEFEHFIFQLFQISKRFSFSIVIW